MTRTSSQQCYVAIKAQAKRLLRIAKGALAECKRTWQILAPCTIGDCMQPAIFLKRYAVDIHAQVDVGTGNRHANMLMRRFKSEVLTGV